MQKKEDKRDEFDKVWADAFKDEELSITPPTDLWDDLEEEVDKINDKKNQFNIFRAAAAIITFGLLSSFLVKNEMPIQSNYDIGSISYSTTDRNVYQASMLPTDFFISSIDESAEALELLREKYIAPSKEIINTKVNPFYTAKKEETKGVIKSAEKEVYYSELGQINSNPKDYSDEILMARQSPSVIEKKKKNKKYLKIEAGRTQIDPNMRYNHKDIAGKSTAPTVAVITGIKMDNNVFVELGARYAQYSIKAGMNDQNISIEQKQLSIPVNVGYTINMNKKLDLDVFAGVAADIIIDQKVEGGAAIENDLMRSAVGNTANISANVGASLNYKIAPKASISLGTTYGSQLLENSQSNEITSNNSVLTFNMGVKYNII
ncbi:porin family protein [Flammeovirga sp. MY04]|uniref:outer membrane beta-barrel protein n=1 Tax=Flammeovirga sp. MY04 TaxID=1191459 RepID=UPI000806427A|nr:outer membrane beta-barrel protein [Flammeovirga sp. MY04]ANQ50473.1 porin family protein [Flammeovirga sp. MY04]